MSNAKIPIVDRVIEEAQARIAGEKAECQEVIDHFCDPIPEDPYERALFCNERLKGGPLSGAGLTKAYERRLDLEIQERELYKLLYMLHRKGGKI